MTSTEEVPRIPCSVSAPATGPANRQPPKWARARLFTRRKYAATSLRCRPTGPGVFGTEQLNVLTLHDKFQDFDD